MLLSSVVNLSNETAASSTTEVNGIETEDEFLEDEFLADRFLEDRFLEDELLEDIEEEDPPLSLFSSLFPSSFLGEFCSKTSLFSATILLLVLIEDIFTPRFDLISLDLFFGADKLFGRAAATSWKKYLQSERGCQLCINFDRN